MPQAPIRATPREAALEEGQAALDALEEARSRVQAAKETLAVLLDEKIIHLDFADLEADLRYGRYLDCPFRAT